MKRRSRPGSRWALLPLIACVALGASGCGRMVELAGLGSDAATPDPDTREVRRRERLFDGLLERLDGPGPSGEVVLRLSLTGGWGLPTPDDLHLTIEDDGRVVRVTDTSVYSSTDDYTSLRLSRAGVRRVLALTRGLLPARREDLDGGAGVSPTERSAWLELGDGIALSMDRLERTEGYTDAQRRWRARFSAVIERIRDLSWLGRDVVEPEAPWIPESMTVLAKPIGRRGALEPGSVARWPLDRSIDALADGTTIDAQGLERLVLCLSGAEVAPVFALLSGVNHASLPVDDGRTWELDVRPHYPGYRLASDPCP